jgi:hypothetical protein
MVTTLLLINRRISVFYLKAGSCDSPVSIVYVYRLNDQGSILGRSKGFFPLASVSRPALGPTQPPSNEYLGPFPGVNPGRGVTLTTHPM